MASRITVCRAARAARQLLYHRRRLAWMTEKLRENEVLLERLLVENGEERATLPGGYVLARTESRAKDPGGEAIEVSRTVREDGYEQLRMEVG